MAQVGYPTTIRGRQKPTSAKKQKVDPGRAARFSASVDTGRWWRGHPEQAQVFIEARDRTLLLGFCKSNLMPNGVAATGMLKPHRYRSSTRPFYYDLSDRQQVVALLSTFRHMAAYGAALLARPSDARYCLDIGDTRELCRTELSRGKFEVLRVECEDRNLKIPGDNKIFARDKELRAAAMKEFLGSSTPVPRYLFRIYRISELPGEPLKCQIAGPGTELDLTLDGAKGIVEHTGTLLADTWRYLERHPEQVELRYDCFPEAWVKKWQLHRPAVFDELLMPMVRHVFQFVQEDALFTQPEVYQASCARLDQEGSFTHQYLERLALYQRGALRWDPTWLVSEHEAKQDLHKVRLRNSVRWYFIVWTHFGAWLLRLLLRFLPKSKDQVQLSGDLPAPCSFSLYPRFIPVARQRGPPT